MLPVRDLLDVPSIPADLLELAREVESYYLTSFSAALSLVCPPTGALKVVRQYELTAGGRAAREAGEEGLDEVAGLKLPAGPLDQARRALPAQGLGAHRLSRARGRGDAGRAARSRRGGETPARLGPRQRAALEARRASPESSTSARCAPPPACRCRRSRSCSRPARSSRLRATPRRRRERRRGEARRPAAARSLRLRRPSSPRPPACRPAPRSATCPTCCPSSATRLHAILCEARPGDEVLVHGVTGSGKTEVYLQAAQAALEGGRSVLLLVPEIGLTGQTVARVRERFAGHEVAVLHSGLTARERLLAYRAVARGEVRIVVGARSAVFAPLRDLGLIVVDEEHDTSYKQESEPAYDARTVARWRAARERRGGRARLGDAERRELCPRASARRPAAARRRLAAAGAGDRRHARPPRHLLAPARGGAHGDSRRRRQGDPLPQPPRLRFVPGLRPLRVHVDVPALRRHADAVRRPRPALPHLRARRGCARHVPVLRQRRARALRLRHRAPRARGRRPAARRGAAAPRLRRRLVVRTAARGAGPLRAARPQGPRRHADDRQGPPLPGRHAGRAWSTPTSRCTSPTSAPRSAPSRCSSRSAGAAAAASIRGA